MKTETDHTPGPLDSLIADWRISRKRLKENPPTTIEAMVAELRDNVYPSMIALAEQCVEIDEVVLEMSEHQDSFIQRPLAAQIFQTVALGAQVVDEVRAFLPELSDIAAKKVGALLSEFERSLELTVMGVSDAAADDEDEDDEDDDTEPGKKKKDEDDEDFVPELPEVAAEGDDTNV